MSRDSQHLRRSMPSCSCEAPCSRSAVSRSQPQLRHLRFPPHLQPLFVLPGGESPAPCLRSPPLDRLRSRQPAGKTAPTPSDVPLALLRTAGRLQTPCFGTKDSGSNEQAWGEACGNAASHGFKQDRRLVSWFYIYKGNILVAGGNMPFLILDLMAALTKKGISVFLFDFSGNGESEGEFEYGNYRKEADDLHSVVSYLYKEKYDVTAIVGHSKGGDVVALYASIYDDVRLVISVSGRFDLEKSIEERIGEGSIDRINKEGYLDVKDKSGNVQYRVTKESLMERLNTDMRAVSISISKECRFFTVHGSADETIPVEDAYEFVKHIPNHKLQVIEGANHNYAAHRKELAYAVVDFITSN